MRPYLRTARLAALLALLFASAAPAMLNTVCKKLNSNLIRTTITSLSQNKKLPQGSSWKGNLYRVVQQKWVPTAGKISPTNEDSFHRYTGKGFKGNYLATSKEGADGEAQHYNLDNVVLAETEQVTLDQLLDLRDPKVLKAVGIEDPNDLVSDCYDACQAIGESEAVRKHYKGLIFPSARARGAYHLCYFDDITVKFKETGEMYCRGVRQHGSSCTISNTNSSSTSTHSPTSNQEPPLTKPIKTFADLPKSIQVLARELSGHPETWVADPVPALGNRSILEVAASEGEGKVLEYLRKVKSMVT